jgi:hypothetical protein
MPDTAIAPLDLVPIKARQQADARHLLERGFHTDPEVAWMRRDRAALLAEVERLRGLPAPVPNKWPA